MIKIISVCLGVVCARKVKICAQTVFEKLAVKCFNDPAKPNNVQMTPNMSDLFVNAK